MKPLITIFFILCMISTNAQIEQTESTIEASVKIECNQIVKGEIRDKNTADLLPGAEVVLSDNQGNILEAQIVKEDATFSFAIKCETAYKLEGRKTDFTAESKSFTTSNEADKQLKILISLGKGNIDFITNSKAVKAEVRIVEIKTEVVPVDIQLNEVKDINLETSLKSTSSKKKVEHIVNVDHIYFDYESSYLSKKAKVRLQKMVALMKKHPKMIVECAGHTDSKGPDSYNVWMADRRAKRVVDYIIKRGVSANRITGKGYGANQLINRCSKDVECTGKEQAMNRRTEFVIIRT